MSVNSSLFPTTVAELQKELRRAQCREKEVMTEYRELKRVVAALKKWEHEVKKEKDEVARLAKQLDYKESCLNKGKQQNNSLILRVGELERKLREMQIKADSQDWKAMEMTDKFEVQKSINQSRDGDFRHFQLLTRDLKNARLENEEVTRQLGDSEALRRRQKEELERKLSLEVSSHNATRAELSRQLERNLELQRKLLDQQKVTSQFERLSSRHEEVKEELVKHQEQAVTLAKTNKALAADGKQMREKVSKMETERQELSERLEVRTKELKVYESKAGGVSCFKALQIQMDEMEAKQSVLAQENDSLESRRKRTKEKLRKALAAVDELTGQNDRLLGHNKGLEARLDQATTKAEEFGDLLRRAEVERRTLLDLVAELKAEAALREEELKAELTQRERQVADLQETVVLKDQHSSMFKRKCSRTTAPGGVRNGLTRGKKHTLHRRFLQKCSVMVKRTTELREQSRLIAQLQQKLAEKQPEELLMELQMSRWDIRALRRKLQAKAALVETFFQKIKKMEAEHKTLTDEVRRLRLETKPRRPGRYQHTSYSPLRRPKLEPNMISTVSH